jgi:hypothetical protein
MARNALPPGFKITYLPELARGLARLRESVRLAFLPAMLDECRRHPELAGVAPALLALVEALEVAARNVFEAEKAAAARARLRVVPAPDDEPGDE